MADNSDTSGVALNTMHEDRQHDIEHNHDSHPDEASEHHQHDENHEGYDEDTGVIEARGVVDRVIDIWAAVKASLKKSYDNSAVPSFLVPARDKVRDFLDDHFECIRNGSSVETEIFAGVLNFFSCMYILAVIPIQMGTAGFSAEKSAAVISLLTGVFSIACGLVTNLPLIIAPTTAVSIYYVSNIRQFGLSTHEGNLSVSYSGIIVILIGIVGPIGRLISKLIPEYIQYAITIGIGLMTALSGLIEIDLVVRGKYTLLAVGTITNEIVIAISGLVLISIGVYYHSKISYVMGLLWGTIIWWSCQHQWPEVWTEIPSIDTDGISGTGNGDCILLIFEIFLLILLSMFGLAKALCDLAEITPTDESIPRGRLLMLVVGVSNLISGMFNGPPIIISPECSSGIKAGSKTGLSSVVAGILFILSMFFAPLFSAIPAAGSTPVLIMIGMLLFQNISRIDFGSKYGMPAFMCLIIIPFTDSIIGGIGFGYVTYIVIAVLNGDFFVQCQLFLKYYCSAPEEEAAIEEHSTRADVVFEGPSLALTGVNKDSLSKRRRPRSSTHGGESAHGGPSTHGGGMSTQSVSALRSAHGEGARHRTASGGSGSGDANRIRTGSSSSVGSGGSAGGGVGGTTTTTAAAAAFPGASAHGGITSQHGAGSSTHGRGRSASSALSAEPVITRARRASAAFLTSITSEMDFKNDIKGTVLRYDHA